MRKSQHYPGDETIGRTYVPVADPPESDRVYPDDPGEFNFSGDTVCTAEFVQLGPVEHESRLGSGWFGS